RSERHAATTIRLELLFESQQFFSRGRHLATCFHSRLQKMFRFCSRLDTTAPRRLQASPVPPPLAPSEGRSLQAAPFLLQEAAATHEGSAPDAARQSLRPRGGYWPDPRAAGRRQDGPGRRLPP